MRRLSSIAIVLTILSLGCAADEPTVPEAPDETAEATGSPAESAEYNDKGTETFTDTEFDVEMELDDFYFEPTFIKSPGDSTASITLKNEGDVPHTFTVDDLDVDEELEPGASKQIAVEIGTETRYEFYCRFHAGQGMRGALQPH